MRCALFLTARWAWIFSKEQRSGAAFCRSFIYRNSWRPGRNSLTRREETVPVRSRDGAIFTGMDSQGKLCQADRNRAFERFACTDGRLEPKQGRGSRPAGWGSRFCEYPVLEDYFLSALQLPGRGVMVSVRILPGKAFETPEVFIKNFSYRKVFS